MDEQKQRIQIAIVALNITMMVLMILFTVLGVLGDGGWGSVGLRILVSFVAGAVVGGITYFVVPMMMR